MPFTVHAPRSEDELLSLPRYRTCFGRKNVRECSWIAAIIQSIHLISISSFGIIKWLSDPEIFKPSATVGYLVLMNAFGVVSVIFLFVGLWRKNGGCFVLNIIYLLIEIAVLGFTLFGFTVLTVTNDWDKAFDEYQKYQDIEEKATISVFNIFVAFFTTIIALIFSIWALSVVRRCRHLFDELASQRQPLMRYQPLEYISTGQTEQTWLS